MTEFLNVEGGRIAYDVTGDGPLLVRSPGMENRRNAYRFLAPQLVAAGQRVAAADLCGHDESSVGWASFTRTDTAVDLLALIRLRGTQTRMRSIDGWQPYRAGYASPTDDALIALR
jgi:hypothetical protein